MKLRTKVRTLIKILTWPAPPTKTNVALACGGLALIIGTGVAVYVNSKK